MTPTGQVLRESVAGLEVLEARGPGQRVRAASPRTPARARAAAARTRAPRAGIGLALAWHGAGFTGIGRGPSRQRGVAGADRRGPDPDPHRARPRWARARRRSFPSWWREALGIEPGRGRDRAQDTSIVPDSGPTVASRTAMVVGGLLIQAARAAAGPGRGGDRAAVRATRYRSFAQEHGPLRVDEQFAPYPGVQFDDATYTGDAYPASAGRPRWRRSRSTSTPARSR